MRIRIFSVVLLFIAVNADAQNGIMSLKQCIETALANNIRVKQSGLQADATEVNLMQAKANRLPDLNGNFGYLFNQGRNVDPLTNGYINQQLTSSNVGLSSGVVLFNGMRLQNLIKQNSFSHEAAKMDWQQEKDNLTLNVILAYLQVLSNEDVLVINKAQADVTKKQVERMEILVKEEAAGNYQLADLKGQQADEEISIINSTNALQQSKLNLSQLMNIDYNADLKLENNDVVFPSSIYAGGPAEVYQSSLVNLALVKANEFKIKSAEKTVKVSRSGYYPTLRLGANLGSSYSSLAETFAPTSVTEVQTGSYVIINSNQNPVLRQQQNYSTSKTGYMRQLNNNIGTFAGINMQIPLFNSFQTRNNVKLAKINLANVKFESDNAKLQLKQNVEQVWLNMTASYNRYKALTEQVNNFEESFRAAEVRFNTGVINSSEYLISKNNLDRTKINLAQSKYEYFFRTKLLDYFQGKPLF
jgi:outer membrane protein